MASCWCSESRNVASLFAEDTGNGLHLGDDILSRLLPINFGNSHLPEGPCKFKCSTLTFSELFVELDVVRIELSDGINFFVLDWVRSGVHGSMFYTINLIS